MTLVIELIILGVIHRLAYFVLLSLVASGSRPSRSNLSDEWQKNGTCGYYWRQHRRPAGGVRSA